ncbi:MAG: histidine phosphatase family protein [Verrucomicrobiota bacterium]
MELKLYIVRHAHADFAETDEIRPLTDKGWNQVERLVSGFLDKELITPAVIWHSGLRRAAETAQGLKDGLALEDCRFAKKNGLAPYDDPAGIAVQIDNLTESAMVVGHNPHLTCLATLLLDNACDRIIFPKASILCLSRMKVGDQSTPWQVQWHLNHKHFR